MKGLLPDVYGDFARKKRVSRGRGGGQRFPHPRGEEETGGGAEGTLVGRAAGSSKSMLIIGFAPLASWRSCSAVFFLSLILQERGSRAEGGGQEVWCAS